MSCLMALGSCSREREPLDIAEAFLQSFFAADYQTARTYAAPELYHILEKSQAIMDSLSEEENELVKKYLSPVKITVDNPGKVQGDTLRLSYRVEFSNLPEPGISVIVLRKERRKWHVFALE